MQITFLSYAVASSPPSAVLRNINLNLNYVDPLHGDWGPLISSILPRTNLLDKLNLSFKAVFSHLYGQEFNPVGWSVAVWNKFRAALSGLAA